MGQASLPEYRESEKESKEDMESYRCLLQAGSQLESTLQQVTVPVSMKEVGGYIQKQVAYLSGGRGEDSSVIITLPECSAFSDIPEEALAKVFTYLTLIPRCVLLHLSLSLPAVHQKPSACILSTAGLHCSLAHCVKCPTDALYVQTPSDQGTFN